jgi:hypothetical protein
MSDAIAIADDRTKRRGRDWGLSPTIERARASREKKPQLPVAMKPVIVEVVEAVIIEPAPIQIVGRVLATFSDYDGLHRAITARTASLGITRLELDHLSGNQEGYSGKLLAPSHYKKFGKVSLGNTVGALGCYLLLIEDQAATKSLLSLPPRPKPWRNHRGASLADIGEKLDDIGCTLALVEDRHATTKIMARAKKRKLPLRQLKLLPPPRPPAIETDKP